MFPEDDIPDEFIEHANEYYEAAKGLSFQAWLQLMTPIWQKQTHEMKIQGFLKGMSDPLEE